MKLPTSSHVDTLLQPQSSDAYVGVHGSQDERAEIEARMQRAVDDHRIRVGPETFHVQPRRSGWVLPVAVNTAALIIIVAGTVLSLGVLASQERDLAASVARISSAEGRVLSEFRRESEARLSSKEAEIAEIEAQLAQAESELDLLRLNAEEELQALETELRGEVEAKMAAEAARLADESLTEAERGQRLEAFRESQQAQLAQDLEDLEARMRAELATEEQALLALVDEYQSSLAAATRQREALESLLRDREQALQEERDTVAQRLEQLRANQEQKRLVLDQLLGHYGRIQQSLDEGDVEEAALRIASLREYVETGPVAHVEDLRTRKDVELFLIETLEERVDAAQTPADSGGAELAELEAERERSAELSARLQETTDRLAATAESLDGARTAIASLRAFVQRQQELADGIDAYRRSFRARSQEADGGRGLPLELLEVKLQVLQILASESVRTEYPDLYHGLNDYLDALVVEQRTDAVRAALRELSTLLDSLGSPGAGPASGRTETSSAYPVLTGPETVGETARLLEALERVVAKMTAKDQE